MSHINYNSPIHVHFIGIGGISMSGLADILFSKGFTISGSDSKESELTRNLISQGIKVFIGQKADNITDDIDLVVYTAAIHNDNEELAAARAKNIPVITRAELLGEIMTNYKTAVGVSGTHGKTTTTSILNIEEDHLDFFKDINDIRNSFGRYVRLLPENGLLVINNDIDNVEEIYKNAACPVITVGKTPDADYTADNISFDEFGCPSYDLIRQGNTIGRIALSVPGIHNVYNSLAAIAVAIHLGIDISTIIDSLKGFHGTDRRFQKKGTVNGFTIIDDYAHHPAEINATINSAMNYPHKKLVIIFQPHTYTRTKAFLKDFADVLKRADLVILPDIYAARETDTLGISSKDIADLINAAGTECIYEPDFDKICQIILDRCQKGDLVITMGAGNVVDIADRLTR